MPVALAFAVLDLTGSPTALGLVFAARVLPTVVLLLVGGVIADRLPRRGVMIAADVARTLSQGAMALVLLEGVAEVWMLAVLAAVGGAATAFFEPAATGLVPMTVSASRLQQANALQGLSQGAGAVAGPVIAGVLVAIASPGAALAVDSATFAVSATFLVALRVTDAEHRSEAPFVAELRDGWHEFRTRDWVWGIVLVAALANMLSAGYSVLGPVIARQELGGVGAWATIATAYGVGSLLGAVLILRRRVARPLLVAVSVGLTWVIPWFLLAIPAPTALVAVGALVGGAGLVVYNALWQTSIQEHIPPRSLSRVSAYDWLGSLALAPVGTALIGPIAAGLGPKTTLLGCAVLVTALNLWALTIPGVRNLRSRVSVDLESELTGGADLRL